MPSRQAVLAAQKECAGKFEPYADEFRMVCQDSAERFDGAVIIARCRRLHAEGEQGGGAFFHSAALFFLGLGRVDHKGKQNEQDGNAAGGGHGLGTFYSKGNGWARRPG